MTKTLLLVYGTVIIVGVLASIAYPNSSVGYVIRFLSDNLLYHPAIALVLICYTLFRNARTIATRLALSLFGFFLIVFGVYGIMPTGDFLPKLYSQPLDTLLYIESGIIALLASLELPLAQKTWVLNHQSYKRSKKDTKPNPAASSN